MTKRYHRHRVITEDDTEKQDLSKARTDAHVATLAASQRVFAASGARVHSDGLLDDETILHQFPDSLTCNTHTRKVRMKPFAQNTD